MRQKNIFASTEAFDVRPFLMAFVDSGASIDGVPPLQCPTQNDMAVFRAELAALPAFQTSNLLRALDLALAEKIGESATLFCAWAADTSPNQRESIILGVPQGRSGKNRLLSAMFRLVWSVPGMNAPSVRAIIRRGVRRLAGAVEGGSAINFFSGYPVFVSGRVAVPMSPDEKLQALTETLDVYETAVGNDHSRTMIIEALAVALGRILAARGRYTDAVLQASRGLRLRQYSPDLRAQWHAATMRFVCKLDADREHMLASMGGFSLQPLMLVCIDRPASNERVYLQCRTQDDADEFRSELIGLPEFGCNANPYSKLLRALELALRGDSRWSADFLFRWASETNADPAESILQGVPEAYSWKNRLLKEVLQFTGRLTGQRGWPVVRRGLRRLTRGSRLGGAISFYSGFPVFSSGCDVVPMSPEQKVHTLMETLDAYEAAAGNDRVRNFMIASLGLGLGRLLGVQGRFAEALTFVDRGLKAEPESIFLKTARHALALRQKDVLATMAAFDFQPFILVCMDRGEAVQRAYIQCRTQNDIDVFIPELKALPEFRDSKLLKALERALISEVHDSAELLYSWAREPGAEPVESLIQGIPRGRSWKHRLLSGLFQVLWRLPGLNSDSARSTVRGAIYRLAAGMKGGSTILFYAGFPVFTSGCEPVPLSRTQKVQGLIETLEAYEAATGNDGARAVLIECLTFALGRILGAGGDYVSASGFIDRGLHYRPYSIYLKAARHALDLRLEGKALPERFEKFIGEDTGYLKKFVCPEPFKRFDIGSDGNVLVCCGHWLPTSIGNFIKDPVDGVLNSEKAQQLRKSVTDGTYQYCNHLDCASMIHDRLVPRDKIEDADIEHAITFQDFRVKRVEQVLFALDQSCNLSCPSCRREQIMEKASDSEEKAEAVELKLLPLLPHVATLNLNSAGELFASKPSRRLLELINDEKFPDLKLQIISNGTLFSEKEWNKFPGIHKKIQWVRISIDAARPRTFEKLRRLGIHAFFLDNIRFLSRLRNEGTIPQLIFSFTYQIDNFAEMAEFVEFAREMKCDRVVFERLQNLGTFTHEEFLERAVHQIEHRLHAEFQEVLRNPIFDHTDVWHDFDYADNSAVSV